MQWALVRVLGEQPATGFEDWVEAFRSTEAWIPYDNICLIMERPIVVSLNELARPHCDDDAAVKYASGWSIYCLDGLPVSESVFKGNYTASDIDKEANIEIRRVMIERYGLARYLADSGAEEIHRDECGILYRKQHDFDEPLVVVQVRNSTPEPDGSYKNYMLRVPPEMLTARSAVAWTFGLAPDEYNPEKET
jgi:hypothetical protein